MPRITRAALRAGAEESASAATIPLPTTPQTIRTPLGEIADNQKAVEPSQSASPKVQDVGPKNINGKRNKVNKKGRKKKDGDLEEPGRAAYGQDGSSSGRASCEQEDSSDSMNSTADKTIKALCQVSCEDATADAVSVVADHDKQPSPAVMAVCEALSQGSDTGFEVDAHHVQDNEAQDLNRATNATHLKSSSEQALLEMNGQDGGSGVVTGDDDSFIEQIKTRTPAKRISRIEDSVEALDALHEEIERVDQAMPVSKSTSRSAPRTTAKPEHSISTHKQKAVKSRFKSQKHPELPKKAAADSSYFNSSRATSLRSVQSCSVKGAEGKDAARESKASGDPAPSQSAAHKDRSALHNRVSSLHKAPFQPTKSTKAPTLPTFELPGDAVARRLKEQRENREKRRDSEVAPTVRRDSSVNKALFAPAKSTKAPTRPNFELPGEAVARKLKEQREARTKHEEVDALKSKTFKARPVRVSEAPTIRTTASSRARLSIAQNTPIETAPPLDAARKPHSGTSCQYTSVISKERRSGMSMTGQPMAKVEKGPVEAGKRKSGTRQSLVQCNPRSAPTAADLAHQRTKGKEVFARPKAAIAEQERVRKEKEAAAKKARIEAAERGRIASREWAEKQKVRKLAEMTGRGASVS